MKLTSGKRNIAKSEYLKKAIILTLTLKNLMIILLGGVFTETDVLINILSFSLSFSKQPP